MKKNLTGILFWVLTSALNLFCYSIVPFEAAGMFAFWLFVPMTLVCFTFLKRRYLQSILIYCLAFIAMNVAVFGPNDIVEFGGIVPILFLCLVGCGLVLLNSILVRS
jgi:hypothetical protein